MDKEEFKKQIYELLSQQYKIVFLGKNLNNILKILSKKQVDKICLWIKKVIVNEIRVIRTNSKNKYKKYMIRDLLVFRYAFKIDNNAYRILLIKVKNSFYIEFHIGNHNYYDNIRKELKLK